MKLVRPIPKENAWRSQPYRKWVASGACEHCRLQRNSQAAHGDLGKGQGIKTDDRTCFAACAARPGREGCHEVIGRRLSRELRRALELRYACRTLARARNEGVLQRLRVELPPWFDERLAVSEVRYAVGNG